uniref:Uncharacterized protein n=1 Tax=Romanomermis culicivorax TaxID=13658 RepID=A0A915ICH4_ROMCU
MDQLASATPCITNYTDQLTSATSPILATTPQVRMGQKIIEPLTARHHLHLDD